MRMYKNTLLSFSTQIIFHGIGDFIEFYLVKTLDWFHDLILRCDLPELPKQYFSGVSQPTLLPVGHSSFINDTTADMKPKFSTNNTAAYCSLVV